MSTTFWILAFPDIPRPIGGIKQMHRLCEYLNACGHSSVLVQNDKDFHPNWFSSSVPTISKAHLIKSVSLNVDNDDLRNLIHGVSSIRPGIRKIIFNQNSSYTSS